MGIRLVSGRNFAVTDHSESPFVVIVNETMARRYWPGVSPVGKRVRGPANVAWREVVGVVSDVKHWGFDRPVNPEMYLPQKQMVWDGLTFVLATDRDPAALTAAVRERAARGRCRSAAVERADDGAGGGAVGGGAARHDAAARDLRRAGAGSRRRGHLRRDGAARDAARAGDRHPHDARRPAGRGDAADSQGRIHPGGDRACQSAWPAASR